MKSRHSKYSSTHSEVRKKPND